MQQHMRLQINKQQGLCYGLLDSDFVECSKIKSNIRTTLMMATISNPVEIDFFM